MSARNAPRLDAGLIARKGQAVPASSPALPTPSAAQVIQTSAGAAPPPPSTASRADPTAIPTPRGLHGTIAVTVRLDPARYEKLKVYGARQRRTNQEILVEALDDYLKGIPE